MIRMPRRGRRAALRLDSDHLASSNQLAAQVAIERDGVDDPAQPSQR
jgi:hypothetical protein